MCKGMLDIMKKTVTVKLVFCEFLPKHKDSRISLMKSQEVIVRYNLNHFNVEHLKNHESYLKRYPGFVEGLLQSKTSLRSQIREYLQLENNGLVQSTFAQSAFSY